MAVVDEEVAGIFDLAQPPEGIVLKAVQIAELAVDGRALQGQFAIGRVAQFEGLMRVGDAADSSLARTAVAAGFSLGGVGEGLCGGADAWELSPAPFPHSLPHTHGLTATYFGLIWVC
ncbi:MAG: hypothetical protein WDA70_01485 [Lysobacteraceae bacterium]